MFLPDPTGKKRAGRKVVFWTVLVLFLAAAALWARPLYHKLKAHRSTGMVAKAERLMKEEQWQEAFTTLQAALQLNPADHHANRVVARLLGAAGRDEAFDFWNILFSQAAATVEDRMELLQLALARNRLDLAEKLVSDELEASKPRPEAFRGAALLADARNNSPLAVQYGRLSLERNANDRAIQFLVARHMFRSENEAEQEEAKAMLLGIIKQNPAEAIAPIQLLASAPSLHRKELEELLGMVRAASNATNDLAVLELALATRLHPEEAGSLVEKAAREAANSPERLIELARWLNQRRQFDKSLQIVKLEPALTNKELFLIHADALAGAGRWLALEEIFTRVNLPIEPVLRELYRARIATELNQLNRASGYWEQAHAQAAGKPEMLRYVAEYAERIGERKQSARAYTQLTKDPKHARGAFGALLRMAEERGDVQELRKLLQAMIELYPNDKAPRSDLAYLNLLLNEQVSRSRAVAEELVASQPKMLAYRTTLALALYRAGEIEKAKNVYEPVTFEWSSALPGWQAVYVAVMGAAGEEELAKKLAPSIPQNRLKAPELRLIERWL